MHRSRPFRSLFRHAQSAVGVERDVDSELAFHLAARIDALVAMGTAETSAREQALHEFGDLVAARAQLVAIDKHRVARHRWRDWWDALALDTRFALRSFARQRAFVFAALITLAIGIGGNVAIFSVVDAILIRPLPYADPSRLVRIWSGGAVPPGIFAILRERSHDVQPVGGYTEASRVSVTGLREPIQAAAITATAELFDVLGSSALIGRTFQPGDDEPGHDRVVVLSHALWRDQFDADPRAIGMPVMVDGIQRTVVGVMPADFRFPRAGAQLWIPASLDSRGGAAYWWGGWMSLVGRLRPGSDRVAAQADVRRVLDGARSAFPMRMPDTWGADADVVPLQDSVVSDTRSALLLLLGAVWLVLLVACVNVANLSLARSAAREREMGIRAALGAGRSRVVRQLLTESAILAGAGAVAGLALAAGLIKLLVALLPADTPRLRDISIDWHALAWTLVLAMLTAIVFGLAPALSAARIDVRASVGSGERVAGNAGGRRPLADALVVAQLSLAVILVAGAALLIESFIRLRSVDLGFRPERVTVAVVPVPSFESDSLPRARAFYAEIIDRLSANRALHAAVSSHVPFDGEYGTGVLDIESSPTLPGGDYPVVELTSVSPDYFPTMRIPLVAGRSFTTADRDSAQGVAVVDEVAARRFWPGQSPLGKRLRYVWRKDWLTVVGVVGGVRRDSLNDVQRPSVYLPSSQSVSVEHRVVVRSTLPTAEVARAVRASVSEANPSVPVGSVRALDDMIDGSAARRLFVTFLISLFAAVALSLGAVGTYGVVAHTVARRRREIGVRLALGAQRRDVMRMVFADGCRLALVGALFGVLGAGALTRLAGSLLYGVTATDPAVFTGVVALMLLVALAATLVPARRASRVDPSLAMRAQ